MSLDAGAALFALPRLLWRWYLDYLVFYEPTSWVAGAARSFRILALVLLAPFVVLTLLDVTSYVIARTLGVIDDTKAATSDRDRRDAMLADSVPTILVQDSSAEPLTSPPSTATPSASASPAADPGLPRLGIDTALADAHRAHNTPSRLRSQGAGAGEPGPDSEQSPDSAQTSDGELQAHAHFFSPAEERSMALSGVGVFSPAATRPPSPALTRNPRAQLPPPQQLPPESSGESFVMIGADGEGEDGGAEGSALAAALRRRAGAGGTKPGTERAPGDG